MSPKRRYVIEGDAQWSGSRRVVHRTVHKPGCGKLRAWAERTHAIIFTDGTLLYLRVRDCLPRERVKQIHRYDALIANCNHYNVNSVEALSVCIKVMRSE